LTVFMNFVVHICANIWYDFTMKQMFANPRQCEELKEMITDITQEQSAKCFEQMLRQRNNFLEEEVSRLQRERINMINEHAEEIKRIRANT
jgi:hypothetical protein